ncbi:MAG: zinc finger domain-containing protein [Pirellulales bacterium]
MPEGHSIRIAADRQRKLLAGKRTHASSPQGRFDGARTLDGRTLHDVEGVGKHLFYHFAKPAKSRNERDSILHIHLGRLGRFTYHEGVPPSPSAGCRLRLRAGRTTIDLSGPTACDLISPEQREAILARLGPDPLYDNADPTPAWEKIHRSSRPIGALLLDQSIIAGLGNIFRAEVLFRLKLHPAIPGDELTPKQFHAIWKDSVQVMRQGVELEWIVTVRSRDVGKTLSEVTNDEHFYVYKRKRCRICDVAIDKEVMGGRPIYFCPHCQKR